MLPILPRWFVAAATLLFLGIPASNAEEIVRKWTGSNGKIITGQLLWAQDDTVYLKDSRYGRRIKVALSNLSAADKLYVSDFLAKAKKEKLVYQFHLVRERYQKNELGTVPEQRNGTFLLKATKREVCSTGPLNQLRPFLNPYCQKKPACPLAWIMEPKARSVFRKTNN